MMIEVVVSQRPTPPLPFVSCFPVILCWVHLLSSLKTQRLIRSVQVNVTLNTREWNPFDYLLHNHSTVALFLVTTIPVATAIYVFPVS